MLEVKMKAYSREERGKQAAKRLRNSGMIPAVMYGHKEETISMSIETAEFMRLLRKEKGDNVIVNLFWDKKNSKKTVIKEVQRNPVTSDIIHIDFQHLIPTEKIEIDVPIVLVGTPVGVKEEGGVVEHVVRKISVKCLPKDIPSHLEIDISELSIGASVHVADLKIKGGEILDRLDETVVTVITPRQYEIEEEKEEEAVAEEEAAVEGEEKEEEKGTEKPTEKE